MISTKKTLIIFLPAILIVAVGLFIRIIQYEPLFPDRPDETDSQNTDVFTIPIYPEDPILGDKKSPITIVAFEDFSCPACKEQSYIFDQLQTEYPNKIKIIWKGLPVSTFPYPSERAHAYAYCAQQQDKFEAFKQYAFTNNDSLSDPILANIAENIELKNSKLENCLNSLAPEQYIEKTKTIAQLLNIQSVPTFFIDNIQIDHPTTIEGWKNYLNL